MNAEGGGGSVISSQIHPFPPPHRLPPSAVKVLTAHVRILVLQQQEPKQEGVTGLSSRTVESAVSGCSGVGGASVGPPRPTWARASSWVTF